MTNLPDPLWIVTGGRPQTFYEYLRTIERPLMRTTRNGRVGAHRGARDRAGFGQYPLSTAYSSEFVQGLSECATCRI